MSREYSRRRRGGGGFPIIIAIIATLIVITVAVFIFTQCSDGGASLFGGGGGATPTPTLIPAQTNSPTPSPVPTEEPVVIATPTPEPTEDAAIIIDQSTPTPSPTPAPSFKSARVWARALTVRSGPGTKYEKIGKARYGDSFEVFDETSRWIKVRYNNSYGWIWEDYCARGDEPLPPKPTAEPDPTLLKSASISGSKVTVKFTEGVYGNEEKTEQLVSTDFTAKEGSTTLTISNFSHSAGSDTVTFDVSGNTAGGKVTVSIKSNTVYGKDSGESGSGSVSTSGTSSDTTAPTVSNIEFDGTETVTITFSEDVTINEAKASITSSHGVTKGSLVSKSGKVYKFKVSFSDTSTGTKDFNVSVERGCGNDGSNDSEPSSKTCSRTFS